MVKVDGAEHAPIARVGDIELHQWDAELLQPRRWLNDALIAFAFEHMAQSLAEESLTLRRAEPNPNLAEPNPYPSAEQSLPNPNRAEPNSAPSRA